MKSTLLFAVLASPLAGFAQDAGPVYELDPFVVDTSGDEGYKVLNSIGGTRFSVPIKEIPLNLQVINEELLEDTFSYVLEDAIKFSAGVTSVGNQREQGNFNVRGFAVQRVKRNGIEILYGQDLTNTSRVEVIKGPASLLYGETQPGGIINYITKRPLAEPLYRVQATAGNYGYFRGELEMSTPVIKDRLNVRLDTSYESYDGWRTYTDSDKFFISPALEWIPRKGTNLFIQYEYLKDNGRGYAGHPTYNTESWEFWNALPEGDFKNQLAWRTPYVGAYRIPAELGGGFTVKQTSTDAVDLNWPVSLNINSWDNIRLVETEILSLEFKHQINPDWTIRLTSNYTEPSNLYRAQYPNRLAFSREVITMARMANIFNNKEWVNQAELTGTFSVLGMRNTLLLGAEYWTSEFRADYPDRMDRAEIFFVRDLATFPAQYPPELAFFSPERILQHEPLPLVDPSIYDYRDREQYAFYLSDLIYAFDERLKLLWGIRYDWQEQWFVETPLGLASDEIQENEAWTPQGGVLYTFNDVFSVYALYSESFKPQREAGRKFDPDNPEVGTLFFLDAQQGVGKEVGFKLDLFDGRLNGTVSYFQLQNNNEKGNATIRYGEGDNDVFRETVPLTTYSEGVEVDLVMEPLERLQVKLGYAYLETTRDSVVENDDGSYTIVENGQPRTGVPEHQVTLWGRYSIPVGRDSTFAIGGGVQYLTEFLGSGGNRELFLDGYTQVDFFSSYTFRRGETDYTVQLNIKNLLDEVYFQPNAVPADPLRWMLSLRVKW
ncbi:MAG: TonB-dependent siderophore receptor [Oceanipulchritudo sp.]